MIHIIQLSIFIKAHAHDDSSEVHEFGRKLNFQKGLNLVVGDNTSGKTTIAKCLYYSLGMEELIEGKRGPEALDKSVREDFTANDTVGNERQWHVIESKVIIRMENTKGKIACVKRNIVGKDIRHNILYICEGEEAIKEKRYQEKYIHLREDHNVDFKNGFYAFLSSYANMPVIDVPASNNGINTRLYMQTLFSLCFIEQTRGWSDFFATIRRYNIENPKQRIIEYAMGYSLDEQISEVKRLKNELDVITNHWSNSVDKIKSYLTYNNIEVVGLEDDISHQKVAIEELRYADRTMSKDIKTAMSEIKKRIEELKKKKNTPQFVDEDFKHELQEYDYFKDKYDDFYVRLREEKLKYSSIETQLNNIEIEIKRYTSLLNVNNVVTNLNLKVCPTCHQPLPISPEEQFVAEKERLEQSRDQLKIQKDFLTPLIKNLKTSIKNKEVYMMYLDKELKSKRDVITNLKQEHKAAIQPLTDLEYAELSKLGNHLSDLGSIISFISNWEEGLTTMRKNYNKTKNDYKEAKKAEENENIITSQQTIFKDLLFKFGYHSNSKDKIFLSEDNKKSIGYLPIVQQYNEFEESLRSSSSASDFIRGIWAYYIVLLKLGTQIPGFLVMDEPCQHSVKESSLKALFEACTDIQERQTILFCSSQPHTEEFIDAARNNVHQTRDRDIIQSIIDSMKYKKINYISVDPRSISLLDD